MLSDVRPPFANPSKRRAAPAWNRWVIALVMALPACPALAASDYPPGLFENSPVVPPGPGAAAPSDSDTAAPSGPAAAPSEPPDAADAGPLEPVAPSDDYCAGVASRTFHSLAEVRLAHARCDPAHSAPPGEPPVE
jgi:hypothetical protein